MVHHRSRPEVPAGEGDRQLISLKEGEEKFKEQARLVRRYGAAAMSWHSTKAGRRICLERKKEICLAPGTLVDEVGFPPQDILA